MEIDAKRYHEGRISQKDFDDSRSEFNVFLSDEKYLNKIRLLFNKYMPGLTSNQKTKLLCKIYMAHYKASENYDTLKEDILSFLPLNLTNAKYLVTKSCFLYEPNNAATFFSATLLMNKFLKFSPSENERRNYFRLLMINILRSLTSCFSLFSLGDDIHAFSTLRGFIEQEIKLCILLNDPLCFDDFIKFNEYNKNLKEGIIDEEMEELFEQNRVYSKSEKESFLLYGWVSRTNKVVSFRRLLDFYSKDDASKIYALYSMASEFVHEDYIGVKYDYIEMRKKYADYLTIIFFKFLYPLVEKSFNHDFLLVEGISVKTLVNLDKIKNELKKFVPSINVV